MDKAHTNWTDSALAQATLDAVPRGLLVIDCERCLLFANAQARAALHTWRGDGSADHLREFLALIDPATERAVLPERNPMMRALRGESIECEEYIVRRPRGVTTQWFECGARPTRGEDGAITGAIFAFSNITDRKKKELAKESSTQLRNFIYYENLAGIVHTSVDGRILDCNDAILRMWGYRSKKELFAVREPQIYYDPAERDRLLRKLAAARRLNEHEICFRRKDGSRCWALVNLRLLDAPVGEIGGSVIATVIDITERKTQEESLRQSEQRFSAFMHHLPGVAFVKDLDGKYVYYNEAAWIQFRMRPEDIVGKTDEQIWSSDHAGRYRENDLAVIEGKRPIEFVETVAHSDGIHSWLIYKFPIIEHGKVVLVGGVGIDITERRILEDQLTQARKMEALGRLAGGVAHDFNNLLTVISGYGQLALEGAGLAPTEKMILWLQEILNSSRRASSLTSQLLAFSRRQAVQPKLLDLGELLRNMLRLLQRVIGEHVDLSVHTGSTPCLIHADVHQIEQVVMNLAVNALDAMPLGGYLEIRCEELAEPAVLPNPDGEMTEPLGILLEVRDTGIGMDETVRPQIFDPFFTSKEKGKGTGLGLSTVYGIVTQAKGRIDVRSVPGEGTVFRIYFPVASGDFDTLPVNRQATAPQGVETILLVEDEESVRKLAKTMLDRLGYEVLVADSGAEAVRIWDDRHGRVDVLLTDVIMPQMSGGDLAYILREKKAGLKVLFMSGYTDDMLAGHGVLAGETQLIQKPFTADALGKKIRDVLDA